MKYPDWMIHSLYFLSIARLPWLCLCFLFAGPLSKKNDQTTISVYCTLGVCIFFAEFWMLPPQEQNCPVSSSSSLPLLNTGLMLIMELLDGVLKAHMCSVGWIITMNRCLSLLKIKCVYAVIFLKSLVSESAVWTAELGCFLSSTRHQVILNLLVYTASSRMQKDVFPMCVYHGFHV